MGVTDRVKEHRRRMREQGIRPIQVWVPDTRAKSFAEEARRQSAIVGEADRHSDDQDFVDAVSVYWDDGE
ncbi:antitoxin MazE [Bacillus sp. SRB_336]|nr:antitoxin MazE [Bacillus sp. SRB_336]